MTRAFRWDAEALWRASRPPHGPVTLRITPQSSTVIAAAWHPAPTGAGDTASLLGAEDEPGEFLARHRTVAQAVRRNPGLRLTRTGLVMEAHAGPSAVPARLFPAPED